MHIFSPAGVSRQVLEVRLTPTRGGRVESFKNSAGLEKLGGEGQEKVAGWGGRVSAGDVGAVPGDDVGATETSAHTNVHLLRCGETRRAFRAWGWHVLGVWDLEVGVQGCGVC